MEKAQLPSPADHPTYRRHRRQLWTQILLPLLGMMLIILGVILLTAVSTFRHDGDVERWAAISTMWIVAPLLAAGLLVLLLFVGLIYGMARLLALVPPYTGQAQKIVWRIQGYAKRGADMAAKPVLVLEGITAMLKRLTGIK